jgi:3-hydroxyacyl-CoA dehydrogenase
MGKRKVAIIGAGMIGRAWAVAFARGGMKVAIWSRSEETSKAAHVFVQTCLPRLEAEGLLNGNRAADLVRNLQVHTSLESALAGAHFVQESFPEDLQMKRDIYATLDRLCVPETIIASSTSAFLPSDFTEHLAGRARCIVAHPINPPYLIPATEVVPSQWTAGAVIEETCAILAAAGQVPVVLTKELEGFVVNRLQGALLNEAFWLVANGYAGVEDVDTALKHGLALRWSFMGPFETIDLNSPRGVREYAERYDRIYKLLHAQMRHRADWSGEVLDKVEAYRRACLPADQLEQRQEWRDRRLMALAAHKLRVSNAESGVRPPA